MSRPLAAAARWLLVASPLALPFLASCSDYDFYTQRHTDFFQQSQRNVVDVLLVVDNSCSMIEEQGKLATNFESFIQYFDGVDVDYQIGVITTDTVEERFSGRLLGGDDEIVLRGRSGTSDPAAGQVLDRVEYTSSWGVTAGVAHSLDPSITSTTYNDVASSWCLATSSFGDGDLGTPGADNPSCGAAGPQPDTAEPDDTGSADTATEDSGSEDSGSEDSGSEDSGSEDTGSGDGPRPPTSRDLLITEFMANPAAAEDVSAEWVEVKNLSQEWLDLGGCSFSDGGRNLAVLADGTLIEPGGYLVAARSSDAAQNGGVEGAAALGDGFTLNDDVKVITQDTDNAAEIFAEMVAQGISGSGIEMGLEAARLALSEPLMSTENAGFLREEANLAFIFVSDEDDTSPYPVDAYMRYFTDLKGEAAYRDHSQFKVSAVVGVDRPEFDGQDSCTSPDGVAAYGSRYVDMGRRTEGLLESICDEDFSPIAAELGLTLSGLAVEFALSELPDETTLEVSLYESNDAAAFVGTLEKDVDYVYLRESNSIRFTEDQVPPAQWYIEVKYELLPTTSSGGGEG